MNDISQSQPATNLPYAQSERLFRNYESYIAQIVSNWSNPTIFDVKGVTVTTFNTRLRMALNSHHTHHWHSPSIDWDKFVDIFPSLAISLVDTPGKVVAGPKSTIKNRRVQGQGISSTTTRAASESLTLPTTGAQTEGLTLTNPIHEVVQALLVLHHHQILVNPTIITYTNGDLVKANNDFDVIVQQDGNTFTIL